MHISLSPDFKADKTSKIEDSCIVDLLPNTDLESFHSAAVQMHHIIGAIIDHEYQQIAIS